MIRSMSLLTTELAYALSILNKCDVTDTLLPHGAAEVRFHSSQRNECSQPRPQAGWNARFSEQNVGRYQSMDMYHVRKH